MLENLSPAHGVASHSFLLSETRTLYPFAPPQGSRPLAHGKANPGIVQAFQPSGILFRVIGIKVPPERSIPISPITAQPVLAFSRKKKKPGSGRKLLSPPFAHLAQNALKRLSDEEHFLTNVQW